MNRGNLTNSLYYHLSNKEVIFLGAPVGPDFSSFREVQTRVDQIRKRFTNCEEDKKRPRFIDVLESSAGKHMDKSALDPTTLPVCVSGRVEKHMDKSALDPLPEKVTSSSGSENRDPVERSRDIDHLVREKCLKYGVDEHLVKSMIKMESGGNPDAVSKAGARGLMQLMPSTAKMLGVEDPFDPDQNLDGGIRYIKKLLNRYKGKEKLALAAYHSGPSRVDQYGGIPPYPIVKHYVKTVLSLAEREGR